MSRRFSRARTALAALAVTTVAAAVLAPTPAAATGPNVGRVVTAETLPLHGVLAATGATAQRITYVSTTPKGDRTQVSGAVLLPPGQAPAGGWPVASWAHGTTGSADVCAPSQLPDFGYPEYVTYIADLIDAGYAVAATDYQGLGTPGPHPYLISESEARGVIDVVRAARNLHPQQLSDNWVAVGHSQGSQAVAAAGEINDTYGGGLDLRGTLALAAPVDLADTVAQRLAAIEDDYGSQAYFTLILAGLKTQHPRLDYGDFLGPQARQLLPLVESTCLTDMFVAFAEADLPGSEFAPTPRGLRKLVRWLRQEGIPRSAAEPPFAVLAGTEDEIVSPEEAQTTIDRMCDFGSTAYLKLYPGVTHDGIFAVATDESIQLLDDRIDGLPAPTSC